MGHAGKRKNPSAAQLAVDVINVSAQQGELRSSTTYIGELDWLLQVLKYAVFSDLFHIDSQNKEDKMAREVKHLHIELWPAK